MSIYALRNMTINRNNLQHTNLTNALLPISKGTKFSEKGDIGPTGLTGPMGPIGITGSSGPIANINLIQGEILQITNNTESTSMTTGAFIVSGGVGISGNENCNALGSKILKINGNTVSSYIEIFSKMRTLIDIEVIDVISAIAEATNDMDTIVLREAAINRIYSESNQFTGTNTFTRKTICTGEIDVQYISVLENNSQNTYFGFATNNNGESNTTIGFKALQTNRLSNHVSIGHYNLKDPNSGASNTSVGKDGLSNLFSGSGNTSIGKKSGLELVYGSYNTYIGYQTGCQLDEDDVDNSTAIGANSIITSSNQIVLGTVNETTIIKGGFVMSIDAISSSITLSNPLLSKYMTTNIVPITITLPTPLYNGICVSIRKAIGVTALVTVAYPSIVAYNSTTSVTSITNRTCSSYVSYNGSWYQESSF